MQFIILFVMWLPLVAMADTDSKKAVEEALTQCRAIMNSQRVKMFNPELASGLCDQVAVKMKKQGQQMENNMGDQEIGQMGSYDVAFELIKGRFMGKVQSALNSLGFGNVCQKEESFGKKSYVDMFKSALANFACGAKKATEAMSQRSNAGKAP